HLQWKDVHSWKPETGPLWVHLDRTKPDAQRWLRKRSGLDPVICDALLAEETRPRGLTVGEGLLVNLRGVNLNPGEEPDDMISVHIWVDADRIITLRAPRLLAVSDVREQLNAGAGPKSPGGIMVAIAERLTERIAPVLMNLDELVDAVEEQVIDKPDSSLRRNLSNIRRQAITLRRYIAPQREAITHLQNSQTALLSQRNILRLRECSDRTTRYVEDLDTIRERAAVVHEEIAGRTSEQMNRTMYALSLVAGIFLPLGFVTGLLGINVGGMPGVESPIAFSIVCLALVGLAGTSYYIFRRMKFF
ncbi:MAG TPA: zinc transporter ZntB, partial [Oceanipulchritudo sp.]|nr:zinc transporter ZntB [Oceanipulchritudo sp.]